MKLYNEQDEENFIITVFTNGHTDGSEQYATRREEDRKVAELLNARCIHLGYSDAPFRKKEYKDFSTLLFHHEEQEKIETELVESIHQHIQVLCEQYQPDELFFPLGIGGHIDHHIATLVGKKMMNERPTFFYEDAPYHLVKGWKERRLRTLFNAATTCLKEDDFQKPFQKPFQTLRQQHIPFVDTLLNKGNCEEASERLYRNEWTSLFDTKSTPTIFMATYHTSVNPAIKQPLLKHYSTEYETFVGGDQLGGMETYCQPLPIRQMDDNCWQVELPTSESDAQTIQSLIEGIADIHPFFVRCHVPQKIYDDFRQARKQVAAQQALPPMSDVISGDEFKLTIFTSKNPPLYVENIRQTKTAISRGAVLEEDGTSLLWSSATMSMTDEEVLFPNDAYEQLYKSMENLRWLLGQFNLKQYKLEYGFAVEDIQELKLYYQEEEDLEMLQIMTPKFVSKNCQIEYIRSIMPQEGIRLMLEAKCFKKGYAKDGVKYKLENGRIRTESFELHVSEHCNLRCDQCCNLSPYHPERFMTLEEVERICDFLEKHIDPDVIKVAGGEPLLHPQLLEILQMIKKRFPGTNLRIITNGLLANRRLSEEMMATIDQLWVSDYRSMPVPETTVQKIKEMAKKEHVLLNIKDVDQFYNIVLTEENKDEERIQTIYDNCWMKHRCLMVRNNTFFKCTRAAYIEDQQRIHNIVLEHPIRSRNEGIDMDDPDFQQKALAYLNDKSYIDSCKLCLGVSGTLFKNRQMKR